MLSAPGSSLGPDSGARGFLIAALSAVLDPLLILFQYAIVALGLAMIGVTFAQVVMRYGLNDSFFGAEELSRFLFSWFIFLSATVGLDRGIHFAMDVVVLSLPRRMQAVLAILVHLIVLSVLAILVVKGYDLAVRNWRQSSPALDIPLSFPYAVIPFAAAVMILVVLRRLLRGQSLAEPALGD